MPAEESLVRHRLLAAAGAALLAAGSGAGVRAQESSATTLRLLPLWVPQAQFAGYYLAKEKGFYARRGLEVDILRGGPDHEPVRALEDGKADIVVLWLVSALSAMDRGVPLAHLAQVFRTSHLEIIAWRDRGVARVDDLHGRRISVWGDPFRPAFAAFFKSRKLEPVIVPQHATVNLFLQHGVDACSVMDYNEYHSIYLAGVDEAELVRFPLKAHGIDFPEDGLYCLRRLREARPEAVKALVEGTAEGWKHAADQPEEALDVVMQRVREANLPTNRTHMRWMLRVVLESIFPAGEPPSPARGGGAAPAPAFDVVARPAYDETARWLLDLKALRSVPSHEEFTRR
jgi:NitT/TauT family transport system substrate-binding protein